jgi:hypothetical protein
MTTPFDFHHLLMLCFGTMLLCNSALANPGGDGGIEIWVDGPADVQLPSSATFPDVATDPQGRSIYVWTVFGADGSRSGIYIRRFDTVGNPLANPALVNTLTDDDQTTPRIAVSSDGTFLVIWQSDESDPGAGGATRRWVRGQAFDMNGQPDGTEQLINDISTGRNTEVDADVAALTGGGYVVVWEMEPAAGSDTNRHIQARLVGANGLPNGASFVANSTIGESEVDPAVTELDDGGFFIAWSNGGIVGRRFNSIAVPQGDDGQLNTNDEGTETDPDLARNTDGRILLVWADSAAPGDVQGRMFNPGMNPLGNDFRLNTLTEGNQRPVRAGNYGSLGFLVAWESSVSAGNDVDTSIQGRTVTGNNQFAGPQFQLNVYTTGGQQFPAVGGLGEVVSVSWRSGSYIDQPTNDVIVGQRWSVCGIFCDGFESAP